jgi:hypothetical protein
MDERMKSIHAGTFHPRSHRSLVHNPALAGSLSPPSPPVSRRALFQVCLPHLRLSSRNFALRRSQATPIRDSASSQPDPQEEEVKKKKTKTKTRKKKTE